MPAINPFWQFRWEQDIAFIHSNLQSRIDYFVHQGIGGPAGSWATYTRKANGSLKRVVSKYLPERESREEAERDLYCWLWYM